MAENIKYQINGQLADNTVTVDNKEDMILVPVSIGSANEARIIAEMKPRTQVCARRPSSTYSNWRNVLSNACS